LNPYDLNVVWFVEDQRANIIIMTHVYKRLDYVFSSSFSSAEIERYSIVRVTNTTNPVETNPRPRGTKK
jgi:hypothetical protein